MSTKARGYSAKPLHLKLGLKPGMTCLMIGAPGHHEDLISDVEGISLVTSADKADVVPDECARLHCQSITGDFAIMSINGLEGFVVVESDRCLDIDIAAVSTLQPPALTAVSNASMSSKFASVSWIERFRIAAAS